MDTMLNYEDLVHLYATEVVMVGSQVTCDPKPSLMKSDIDYLVLVEGFFRKRKLLRSLKKNGFRKDGGPTAQYSMPVVARMRLDHWGNFVSFRKGQINLIITKKSWFFNAFIEATREAKKLNLLQKEDRIALFQKRLYSQNSDWPEHGPYANTDPTHWHHPRNI